MMKVLFAVAALLCSLSSVRADFAFTSGSGNTAFDFTCFTSKHCFASVSINSAGTEIFTTGNPGVVSSAALGAAADSVCATSTGSCSLIALTKFLNTAVSGAIPAGTALIGKVGLQDNSGNAYFSDPCQRAAKTYTPISITTSTTTRIVAPSASNRTYVCNIVLTSAAADNVGIVEGTGGTCGTGTAGVIGGTTAANGPNFPANGGVALGNGGYSIAATAGMNVDLCLITSAATPLAGHITWVQAP